MQTGSTIDFVPELEDEKKIIKYKDMSYKKQYNGQYGAKEPPQ